MKNTIKVTIPFSFKGVEYSPSSTIDLDLFIQGEQTIENSYQLVANENKIDNFSYEYEVLESSPKIFSSPTGAACDFLSGTDFDIEGFRDFSKNKNVFTKINTIAKSILGIDDLDAHPNIKAALLKAYEAGNNQKDNN